METHTLNGKSNVNPLITNLQTALDQAFAELLAIDQRREMLQNVIRALEPVVGPTTKSRVKTVGPAAPAPNVQRLTYPKNCRLTPLAKRAHAFVAAVGGPVTMERIRTHFPRVKHSVLGTTVGSLKRRGYLAQVEPYVYTAILPAQEARP